MINYDNLLKKIPKVKKILDDGSNTSLYHYTKPEKLLSILESGTIRFSNALYLNDKEEVTYSYKLIISLIDEMSGLNKNLFGRIRDYFYSKYTNIINGTDDFNNKFEYYTISKGDSLYGIARRYNINPELLAGLNGLSMDDYIYPDQEILIPKIFSHF